VTILIVLPVVLALVVVGITLLALALVRRTASGLGRQASGFAQESGAETIAQHAGELAQLEGLAGRAGQPLDLAEELGTKVPGTGMQQPIRGTLHVVGRSAPEAREMRAPCTIAYAVESPGVPAFSGEQVFEVWTAQWPEPGDTLPCLYDAANPTHVDIDWGQVPSSGDQALGDAQALADRLNAQATPSPGTVDPSAQES